MHTRLRYQAYLRTPQLWLEGVLSSYPQVTLSQNPPSFPETPPPQRKRLGKLVESYVYHQLQHTPDIVWIADGLQIQQERRTLGEIDALYYHKGKVIHLEVAYKFYLYDTQAENATPLERWIGPNRNDSLSQKLQKLATKQFPLLHHPASATTLRDFGLGATEIEQRISCKGQLFVPYQQPEIDVPPLNPACIAGFHLPFAELDALDHYRLYVPDKLDWLIEPHVGVEWLEFAAAQAQIAAQISSRRSPIVWWRSSKGEFGKCFVRWWE